MVHREGIGANSVEEVEVARCLGMKLQVTAPMTFRIKKGGQLLHRYRANVRLQRSLVDANRLEIPSSGSSNGLKEVMIQSE